MRILALGLVLCLAACTVAPAPPSPQPGGGGRADRPVRNADEAVAMLARVVDRVEPVAERECRQRTRGVDCDLNIFIDDDPRQPPNAFQTLSRGGEPVIVFTIALARDARNDDELAFILGHEAAHHIQGHIPQTQQSAVAAAMLAGILAQAGGGNAESIRAAQNLGATVGARAFSKDFELQADQLGTVIAARAGYNPVRGARYFERVPDPGNRFLGTHPPNSDRQRVVRETAARL